MALRPVHCFTPYSEHLNKHVRLQQHASCKLLFSCFCFVFRYISRCSRPQNNVKSPDCRFSNISYYFQYLTLFYFHARYESQESPRFLKRIRKYHQFCASMKQNKTLTTCNFQICRVTLEDTKWEKVEQCHRN